GRQRLWLEQQRWIGGDPDLGAHADLLEHLPGAPLPDSDPSGPLEALPPPRPGPPGPEGAPPRPGRGHRGPGPRARRRPPQVLAGLGVVEDAASAHDEQVERANLRPYLVAREVPHGHRALDLVTREGVLRVAREDRDLHRQSAAETAHDHVQDRLVAE